MGWGDARMEGEGENDPQIQVSCEASAGVEGYTCQRPGASLCRLSASLFLSSWTCRSFTTPHLTDPGQLCPAMRGHLWEFIPDAFCSPCALISSLFVTAGRIQQSVYMSLLYLLNHLWMLFIFSYLILHSQIIPPPNYIHNIKNCLEQYWPQMASVDHFSPHHWHIWWCWFVKMSK